MSTQFVMMTCARESLDESMNEYDNTPEKVAKHRRRVLKASTMALSSVHRMIDGRSTLRIDGKGTREPWKKLTVWEKSGVHLFGQWIKHLERSY